MANEMIQVSFTGKSGERIIKDILEACKEGVAFLLNLDEGQVEAPNATHCNQFVVFPKNNLETIHKIMQDDSVRAMLKSRLEQEKLGNFEDVDI